jgi:DNA-binding transcriptional LysR family regulator
VLPLHVAAGDVASGSPHVVLQGAPLFLITRKERPLPPRIAAFRDYLVENVVLRLTQGHTTLIEKAPT